MRRTNSIRSDWQEDMSFLWSGEECRKLEMKARCEFGGGHIAEQHHRWKLREEINEWWKTDEWRDDRQTVRTVSHLKPFTVCQRWWMESPKRSISLPFALSLSLVAWECLMGNKTHQQVRVQSCMLCYDITASTKRRSAGILCLIRWVCFNAKWHLKTFTSVHSTADITAKTVAAVQQMNSCQNPFTTVLFDHLFAFVLFVS